MFCCGTVSLLLSRAFTILRFIDPSGKNSWFSLSVIWAIIGGLSVIIAIVPKSWIERACGIRPDQVSLIPVKFLCSFAIFSYLLTVGLYFAPGGISPSRVLVYSLCPACTLTVTVDPHFSTVLLLLGPINGLFFGSLGAVLGYGLLAFRNRG
jgi:hypothetical protein